jgi:D-alanyl-D-alanine carboxypeptidase (penicillin-binding protein 5/6)
MKTGYTEAAGYCLVSSASRDGMRIVSAVMGTDSPRARLDASQALLNYGFRFFETHRVYAAGDRIDSVRVWKGTADIANLGVDEDVYVTIPRGAYDRLQPTVSLARTLYAPVERGADVGRLKITLDGDVIHSAPLKTLENVPEGGFFARVADEVRLWFE